MAWSKIYTVIKSKSIDLTALVISVAALFTSCSNQNYVEAAYENNQKIIVYSKKNIEKNTMQVQALGDGKKILSINIIFPKGFTKKEEYIDSTELFYPNQNMNVLIANVFPKGMAEGEYSVAIPVRFIIRYATEGDAYIDNSIYMMDFYINVKEVDSKRRISINDIQITYAGRTPRNILYYMHLLIFGEIDQNNIDKMFENKQYSKSIKFVGSI